MHPDHHVRVLLDPHDAWQVLLADLARARLIKGQLTIEPETEFAHSIIVQHQQFESRAAAALRVFKHLLIAHGVAERGDRPAADPHAREHLTANRLVRRIRCDAGDDVLEMSAPATIRRNLTNSARRDRPTSSLPPPPMTT